MTGVKWVTRRAALFSAALALASCGAESAQRITAPPPSLDLLTNGDMGFVTTGGSEITITVDDVTHRWSFVAKRDHEGVRGNFEWSGELFGEKLVAHGRVTCYGIVGNRARLGGVVTHSNSPGFVDAAVMWSVEDNGEGSSAEMADRATTLQFGDPAAHCQFAPAPDPTTFPVETGNVQVHGG